MAYYGTTLEKEPEIVCWINIWTRDSATVTVFPQCPIFLFISVWHFDRKKWSHEYSLELKLEYYFSFPVLLLISPINTGKFLKCIYFFIYGNDKVLIFREADKMIKNSTLRRQQGVVGWKKIWILVLICH